MQTVSRLLAASKPLAERGVLWPVGRCCDTGGPTPQCLRSDTACRRQPLETVLAPGENGAGHMGSQSMTHSIILFSFRPIQSHRLI